MHHDFNESETGLCHITLFSCIAVRSFLDSLITLCIIYINSFVTQMFQNTTS